MAPNQSRFRRRRQWSVEKCLADLRELQATAMGMSPCGRLVMLAGKRSFALVPIEGEESRTLEISLRLTRPANSSKQDIAQIAWNPQPQVPTCVALSPDRVEFLTVGTSSLELAHTLKGAHSRTITCVDWCEEDPNSIATSSADGFVKVWDRREAGKTRPTVAIDGFTTVSHVRWKKNTNFTLATTHGGDVKLWDIRHHSQPQAYLALHNSNILSFDWSRNNVDEFASSEQDCTLKIYDTGVDAAENDRRESQVLKTSVPVWKARYAPFGSSLATVIVPHVTHDVDNSLFLWETSCLEYPVHCFFGHRDVILDFDWAESGGADGKGQAWQLVTWSRDHTLRVWHPVHVKSLFTGDDEDVEEVAVQDDAMSNSNSQVESEADEDDDDAPVAFSVKPVVDPSKTADKQDTAADTGAHSESGSANNSEGIPSVQSTLTSRTVLSQLQEEEEDTTRSTESATTNAAGNENVAAAAAFSSPRRSREATPTSKSAQRNALQKEFQELNVLEHSRVLRIEDLNWVRRCCKVSSTLLVPPDQTVLRLFLRMNFPPNYPETAPPTFIYGKGTSLDTPTRSAIFKTLRSLSSQLARRQQPCLEAVLRQLASMIDALERGEKLQPPPPSHAAKPHLTSPTATSSVPSSASALLDGGGGGGVDPAGDADGARRLSSDIYVDTGGGFGVGGRFGDSNVPYPRTSGASFGGNGHIVCFAMVTNYSYSTVQKQQVNVAKTPRSLSAFSSSPFPLLRAPPGSRQSPGSSNYSTLQSIPHVSSLSSIGGGGSVGGASTGDSLKRKGRFRVRRVRSGSIDGDEGGTAVSAATPAAVAASPASPGKRNLIQDFHKARLEEQRSKMVSIYNVSKLFPFDKRLATKYVVREGYAADAAKSACLRNAVVAARAGKTEAARLWQICAQIAETAIDHAACRAKMRDIDRVPLSHHPMGRPLLSSIVNHLLRLHDVQMAAIISCIFKPGRKLPTQKPEKTATTPPSVPLIQKTSPLASPSRRQPGTSASPKKSPSFPSQQRVAPVEASPGPAQQKAKFWFLKPGALPAAVTDGSSAYHTIHVASTANRSASPKNKESSGTGSAGRSRSSNKRRRKQTAPAMPPLPPSPQRAPTPQQQLTPERGGGGGGLSSAGSESNLERFVAPYYSTWYRTSRSNSWSDPVPVADDAASEEAAGGERGERESSEPNWSDLLDPEQDGLYESLRLVYANILSNWGLLQQRASLLKFSSAKSEVVSGLELCADCPSCAAPAVSSASCYRCGALVMKCAVCRLPVRGLATRCEECQHGGHWQHWVEWFRGREAEAGCPTGCGCKCLDASQQEGEKLDDKAE